MQYRSQAVDHYLRRMFVERLRRCEAGQSLPSLHRVVIDRREDHGLSAPLLIRVEWRQPDGSLENHIEQIRDGSLEIYEDYWERLRRRSPSAYAFGVEYDARALWSEAVEDHLMQLEIRAVRENMMQLMRVTTDPAIIARAQEAYQTQVDHIRRYHEMSRRPPRNYSFEGPARQQAYNDPYFTAQVQQQIAAANQMQQLLDRQFRYMTEVTGVGLSSLGSFTESLVGSKEAQTRGIALLKEHLSPAQRESYEKYNYFDVVGCDTGHTYRIYHGRQMNIKELDKNGRQICGWCFVPQGNLVAGDVMLAQKTALELYERKALRVANQFAAYAPLERGPGDSISGGIFGSIGRYLGF